MTGRLPLSYAEQTSCLFLATRRMADGLAGYWSSRFLFERALALIYLLAFVCAANQFVPLLGEHGLLPVSRFVRAVPFRASPSLFFFAPTDTAFRIAAWLGIVLSCAALGGLIQRSGLLSSVVWAVLWLLYLSFVNVGQVFYGFGWESLLLETGFFAIFLGSGATAPSAFLIWIWRWVLFRDMFGAGLIKLRGDSCWRDLTCLNYLSFAKNRLRVHPGRGSPAERLRRGVKCRVCSSSHCV
jgi:hypothetical protein